MTIPSITSLPYLVFLLIGFCVYYIVPRKAQWLVLLAMSIAFYVLMAAPYTFLYLLISAALAYGVTMVMQHQRDQGRPVSRGTLIFMAAAIAVNILLWFILKARELWALPTMLLLRSLRTPGLEQLAATDLAAALGMGYYTLQVIGYVLDCYWGNAAVQKNPLKLLLFVCFFPQMTTGPISRYHQLEGLYTAHSFCYEDLTLGCQRILWGFFKKLVLAERLAILISDLSPLGSGAAWVIFLLYPMQMYADFSGCMDISIGSAQLFGISLPENFRTPFFSRTSQEFWQRWHITLGGWAKDYVLYPLLKSRGMVRLGKAARKKFGRKHGKFLVTALGMLVLWTAVGVWHGGYRFIVGVSLWYWLVLMLAEVLKGQTDQVLARLKIPTAGVPWHIFQSARTYVIYAVGASFFRLGAGPGFAFLGRLFGIGGQPAVSAVFPPVSGPQEWFSYFVIPALSILLLFAVELAGEKVGSVRAWIARRPLLLRWLLWLGLFYYVVFFGMYGPGFQASEFIYQGF